MLILSALFHLFSENNITYISISLHLHAQPPSSSPCLIRSRGHKPSIVRSRIAGPNSHSTYSPYLKPEPLYHKSPLAWNNHYIIFGSATNRMHFLSDSRILLLQIHLSNSLCHSDVLIQRAYLEHVNPLADAEASCFTGRLVITSYDGSSPNRLIGRSSPALLFSFSSLYSASWYVYGLSVDSPSEGLDKQGLKPTERGEGLCWVQHVSSRIIWHEIRQALPDYRRERRRGV